MKKMKNRIMALLCLSLLLVLAFGYKSVTRHRNYTKEPIQDLNRPQHNIKYIIPELSPE
ncbi:MAG: hypothetical protein ABIG89_02410 [Candidatus Woesearchaeota archaeon]